MILPLFCLLFIVSVQAYKPDDVSAFFLKAPKSVPRAGRSAPGAYDGFFLKASKSVPRVGRRDGYMVYSSSSDNEIQPQLINYYDKWQYYDNTPQSTDYVNDNNFNKGMNLAITPSEFNDGNLPHRSRRYNLVPYTFSQQNAKDSNTQTYHTTNGNNKEIEEAHYQSD